MALIVGKTIVVEAWVARGGLVERVELPRALRGVGAGSGPAGAGGARVVIRDDFFAVDIIIVIISCGRPGVGFDVLAG